MMITIEKDTKAFAQSRGCPCQTFDPPHGFEQDLHVTRLVLEGASGMVKAWVWHNRGGLRTKEGLTPPCIIGRELVGSAVIGTKNTSRY
jgi:hypothetical protein